MKKIRMAIRELKSLLVSVNLLEGFLDGLILFLIIFALLLFTTIPPLWSGIVFIPYLIWHIRSKLKKVNLENVENKTKEVEWQLRTVADNLDKENEIVNELNNEVLFNMKKIMLSDYINFKKIIRQVSIASLFVFLIIFLASANVQFIDLEKIASEFKLPQRKSSREFEPYSGYEIEEDGDIWGDESIAELGNKELELQVNPMMSEININDINDVEKKEFRQGEIPEIVATTDTSFDEDIPREHREIVKRYFLQIKR